MCETAHHASLGQGAKTDKKKKPKMKRKKNTYRL
jgi:hypothetical protein